MGFLVLYFCFFFVFVVFFFFLFFVVYFFFFFFFSSRRRHTRYWRDWSSDVCSSDLFSVGALRRAIFSKWHPGKTVHRTAPTENPKAHRRRARDLDATPESGPRSEERRVGKECRSRWSA